MVTLAADPLTTYDPARAAELLADPNAHEVINESRSGPPWAVCRCGEVFRGDDLDDQFWAHKPNRDVYTPWYPPDPENAPLGSTESDEDLPTYDSAESEQDAYLRGSAGARGQELTALQFREETEQRARKQAARQRAREELGLGDVPDVQNPDRPSNQKAYRAAAFQRFKHSPLYKARHPGTRARTDANPHPTQRQRRALQAAARKLDRL